MEQHQIVTSSLLISGLICLFSGMFRKDKERSWTQQQIGFALLLAGGLSSFMELYA